MKISKVLTVLVVLAAFYMNKLENEFFNAVLFTLYKNWMIELPACAFKFIYKMNIYHLPLFKH